MENTVHGLIARLEADPNPLCHEAADEIHRLRHRIKELVVQSHCRAVKCAYRKVKFDSSKGANTSPSC